MRGVLEREHRLKQRAVSQATAGCDRFHDLFEGNVGVLLRLQCHSPHLCQHTGRIRGCRQIDPQCLCIDEHAQHRFQRLLPAPGDGNAGHDIVLPGQPGHQHRPAGQQHHERRTAVLLTERLDRLRQRGIEADRQTSARHCLSLGTRVIRRQRQALGRTAQPVDPILLLVSQRTVFKQSLLPLHVVGILQCGTRQRGLPRLRAGVIGR